MAKLLTNVTRIFITDVAGVLDTPLKLVNKRNLNMKKCYTLEQQTLINHFLGGMQLSGGQFPLGAFFREAFFPGNFFQIPISTS